MSELLRNYNWSRGEFEDMAGTEDWVEAALINDGGGYEWTDFNVFWSPSARLYFWHGDSGCSCNSWGDDVRSAADFESGDRDAVLRGWDRFAESHWLSDGFRARGWERLLQLDRKGVLSE